jgi:hypothetical protein
LADRASSTQQGFDRRNPFEFHDNNWYMVFKGYNEQDVVGLAKGVIPLNRVRNEIGG